MECSKIKIKSHKPITFVFLALWEPIISYNFFLWQALECSEISSPIIPTHKNPPLNPYFFLAWSRKKIDKFYGDVTLVLLTQRQVINHKGEDHQSLIKSLSHKTSGAAHAIELYIDSRWLR
jgi:hypothetical protein